ncbi:hypothetical protein ALC56_02874 [Trachymyrmex septentrionalis]|uniref:Uncharacterized protein n=1 Tax=Trachymyrmex septentrionalis TaxID=34720 RepID=A0A151K016_9HYME|nr:hypothetical protein ALC56_02874 [Trachymyrmex septentrionalis]
MSPRMFLDRSTDFARTPSSRVATAATAPNGCSSYSSASSWTFRLAFLAEFDDAFAVRSQMIAALAFSALLSLASAVNLPTFSGFNAGLPCGLFSPSLLDSEEEDSTREQTVLFLPSLPSLVVTDSMEPVDSVLEIASPSPRPKAAPVELLLVPALLHAGPERCLRSSSGQLISSPYFDGCLSSLLLLLVCLEEETSFFPLPATAPPARVYSHPSSETCPREGAPSSPRELVYGSGPRNVSSGTLVSSPLSGCGASPLMGFGSPSLLTTRALLRVAPPGKHRKQVGSRKRRPCRILTAAATSDEFRRPMSRFERDDVAETLDYYFSAPPRPQSRNMSEWSGGGGDRAPCLGICPSGRAAPPYSEKDWGSRD